jgi:hypothetical protein
MLALRDDASLCDMIAYDEMFAHDSPPIPGIGSALGLWESVHITPTVLGVACQ